jgi:hypothetical protein
VCQREYVGDDCWREHGVITNELGLQSDGRRCNWLKFTRRLAVL